MEFRIADTFTESLLRLSNEEQKAVKTTAFDLQLNPANPGIQLHKLERARDPHFWSARVSSDIRMIVHRTQDSMLLCYVDHHDKAYQWALRRTVQTHPATGAAQLVEVRELIEVVTAPLSAPEAKACLFGQLSGQELLSYGVPEEWLEDVRGVDADALLELASHLPVEAAEALLVLATGEKPPACQVLRDPVLSPFDHPDALRRFRMVRTPEDLQQALIIQ